ncbi:vWA domain-containing protein [Tropicimonas sp. IMCC6043]|uniref:vWA domain-containing protein n=1 Tax=Tropicimonas sp. IMCC6043 TaxID=2510645 RepID=UPI00101BA6B7|nr:vWA domain-containing protein [Tropicimonas sp. IMCC6043]RYH08410.1 VWA domain-containing protein [Tropicimonas sp. IMCC6043]
MIVFTLFILICMLLAVGAALDVVRTEFSRIKLQNVTDAAVLAAADLDQTLDPRAVVEDYLRRAGIDPAKVEISVKQGLDAREVTATSRFTLPTMFMDMVGIRSLVVPAGGTARESVSELEIALVLDNSGSMAQNSNYRMNLLKPAAKNFVEQVLTGENSEGKVAISIIPFATQVTAGADLLGLYNASSEHGYSHCVTYEDADFGSTALSTTLQIARTAHFDPSGKRKPPSSGDLVCQTTANRAITPWSDDIDFLKARIDAMQGAGWTSIELGAKWGAALLDPTARPVLSALVDSGKVDEKFRGQPFDYHSDNELVDRKKYLIIMSDGENTNQYDILPPFRDGASTLFYDGSLSSGPIDYSGLSYYDADRVSAEKYYRFSTGDWDVTPTGQSDAVQMTWPEVWNAMSVKYYTETLFRRATGQSSGTEYDRIVKRFYNTDKNVRTSMICSAAKQAGVIVFTIGMDTYGQGDATLDDCASGEGYFYDVESNDLDQAFTSIARTINQLRLTN